MKIEIDNENPQASIKKIQESIDELVDVIHQQKKQLLENVSTMTSAEEQIINLTNSAVDLADTLKAVHVVLHSKRELFKDDEDVEKLVNMLSTFVVSSSAIKLGVISDAREK